MADWIKELDKTLPKNTLPLFPMLERNVEPLRSQVLEIGQFVISKLKVLWQNRLL